MKVFKHDRSLIHSIISFRGERVLGIKPCYHAKTCPKRYKNTDETCGVCMIVTKSREGYCPCLVKEVTMGNSWPEPDGIHPGDARYTLYIPMEDGVLTK